MTGIKHDEEKMRPSLVPVEGFKAVLEVLEYGARKYGAKNWQSVEPPLERYSEALARHFLTWMKEYQTAGSPFAKDPETGFTELAHMATNIFFLLWFLENPKDDIHADHR